MRVTYRDFVCGQSEKEERERDRALGRLHLGDYNVRKTDVAVFTCR